MVSTKDYHSDYHMTGQWLRFIILFDKQQLINRNQTNTTTTTTVLCIHDARQDTRPTKPIATRRESQGLDPQLLHLSAGLSTTLLLRKQHGNGYWFITRVLVNIYYLLAALDDAG